MQFQKWKLCGQMDGWMNEWNEGKWNWWKILILNREGELGWKYNNNFLFKHSIIQGLSADSSCHVNEFHKEKSQNVIPCICFPIEHHFGKAVVEQSFWPDIPLGFCVWTVKLPKHQHSKCGEATGTVVDWVQWLSSHFHVRLLQVYFQN